MRGLGTQARKKGNMALTLAPEVWAKEQFGACELGNRLRNPRLIQVATKVATNPSASFPQQMGAWGDLKAAYRLFEAEGVTFAAVAEPHWRKTRACPSGRYLVLGDTTEIDFGKRRKIPDLAPTGNGTGYGFLLHSGLMVELQSEEVLGLTGQVIHYRQEVPKGENASQRLQRERESEIWGQVIDLTGPPPEGGQFIHVLDRGADNFEVYCHCQVQRCDWVVRVTQRQRKIRTPSGAVRPLADYLATLAVAGTYELSLRARPKHPARTALLEVRFGALAMPPPQHQSPYVKQLQPEPIPMWVVWIRELHAPRGIAPLEWVLYHSRPVESFDDAWAVTGYYEKRPLIEEWHKALKSGCHVTQRQLKTKERLEPMVGLMSVVAVRLLQLKTVAKREPMRPAHEVVPAKWVAALAAARGLRHSDLTAYQFYREMAKLGGFLGRRSDGEPGWITIWRGWEKLHTLIQGSELTAQMRQYRQKPG